MRLAGGCTCRGEESGSSTPLYRAVGGSQSAHSKVPCPKQQPRSSSVPLKSGEAMLPCGCITNSLYIIHIKFLTRLLTTSVCILRISFVKEENQQQPYFVISESVVYLRAAQLVHLMPPSNPIALVLRRMKGTLRWCSCRWVFRQLCFDSFSMLER